ncbi:MAG: HIT family protein [Eubacteriales bacterium]|nr:HIT family protein [Eubacteriales bacterium]
MTDNCIFCKIANGEIPSATLYEDDDFKVILDVSPAAKGHMLILPRQHYADIMAMPEELTAKAFVLAKKMAAKLEKVLECDGINLVQNNHEAAGQTVFHFHIHVIPRYAKDKLGIGWKPGKLSDADRDELVEKFKTIV